MRTIGRLLREQLTERQLIVVSHREPRIDDIGCDGGVVNRHPVSGLVTAVDPLLRAVSGTWIARATGTADRLTADAADRVRIEDEAGAYTLRRVWLTRAEERGHYEGFSNTGLWPLCHLSFETPRFRRRDWLQYEAVNERFADAVASEATAPDPIVFIQDYHFALLPQLVRARLQGATVVCFWHIPWPSRTRFERCPYGTVLLEAMLSADLLGFQTSEHAQHFLDCARGVRGAAVDVVLSSVMHHRRATTVAAFPISVEHPSRWACVAPTPDVCRARMAARFGFDSARQLVVAVDRLDYTKGIEERLAAIRLLLTRPDTQVAAPVFLQVASPSRTQIPQYRDFGARVRAQVAAINDRFRQPNYEPVVWIEDDLEPDVVFQLYRAADVCHVNSLDDGMNLVAKEFVSAREDGRGVLVLSRFTGAARALDGALRVNPYDIDGTAETLLTALRMPAAEQDGRLRPMRAHLADHDVFHWADGILGAAVRPVVEASQVATVFPA
jgi:trehalose 6-phosphate synthase